jgi:hypothetical protein
MSMSMGSRPLGFVDRGGGMSVAHEHGQEYMTHTDEEDEGEEGAKDSQDTHEDERREEEKE